MKRRKVTVRRQAAFQQARTLVGSNGTKGVVTVEDLSGDRVEHRGFITIGDNTVLVDGKDVISPETVGFGILPKGLMGTVKMAARAVKVARDMEDGK